MKIKKILAYASAALLTAGTMLGITATTAQGAPSCVGTWSVGMGGFNIAGGQDSRYFVVNQPVGYNSWDPMGGYWELNRLVVDHRAACPGDHIKILGHSEGAAIVHAWLGQEGHKYDRMNAILLSDPKRPGGIGLNGISELGNGWLGFPLAGNDANYGGVPTLQVCNWADVICNNHWDWSGYLFGTAHSDYDPNAWHYDNHADGTWMR